MGTETLREMDADDFYEVDDPHGPLLLGPQFAGAYEGLRHGEEVRLVAGGARLKAWMVRSESGPLRVGPLVRG